MEAKRAAWVCVATVRRTARTGAARETPVFRGRSQSAARLDLPAWPAIRCLLIAATRLANARVAPDWLAGGASTAWQASASAMVNPAQTAAAEPMLVKRLWGAASAGPPRWRNL